MVQPATVSTTAQPVTNSADVEFSYNANNQLEMIIANGTTYMFAYDEFGNQESVAIGGYQIVFQETNAYNGKVTKVTYANGTTVEYTYDHLERVTEIKYTTGEAVTVYSYEYDSNGNLCRYVDGKNGTTTIYKYDGSNKLVKMIEYDTEEAKNNFGVIYNYDEESRIDSVVYTRDYVYNNTQNEHMELRYRNEYNVGTNSSLSRITTYLDGGIRYITNYTYDSFSRVTDKEIAFSNINNNISYEYVSNSGATSLLISSYTSEVKNGETTIKTDTYKYTYDEAKQNITEIRDANNNLLYRYTYDSLDRLVREDNSVTNRTHLYTYDNNGNITGETVFLYTLGDAYNSTFVESNLWSYSNSQWGDQLTNYNGGNILYDSIGNPTRYYNGLEFAWDNVNNLASISDGWLINAYTYNDSGIRTSKTVNGVTHTYHLDGARILSESYGNSIIVYIYDESGSIMGMGYRDSTYRSGSYDMYLFTKNLQGDIIGIYDTIGTCVASYKYNAWGEHTVTNYTSANIGNINPFRYRGYYYDQETGFYYLNARYYDPCIKRFINADNQLSTSDMTGMNLYAYCGNNPVNRIDPTGEAWWHWALGAAVVAVCAVATVVTCGGFAAAATAVCMVGSGVAAATTASTVAAGAFIGAATVYGVAVVSAASSSDSIQEFNEQGNWGTVAATVGGALVGGVNGYEMAKTQIPSNSESAHDTFLPDSFYSKHAPKQSTPYSSYTNYTYNGYTNKYEKSTAYYDIAGRQSIRIDWTNHGYSDHGYPHIHYTTYNSQYRDGITIRWD